MKQNCRKWIASGLILANSLLLGSIAIPTSATAQERSAREICLDAIGAAKSRILDGRTINLQIRAFDLSEIRMSSGYPTGRSEAVQFTMARFSRPGFTADGEAIMTSPVFMKSIATDIINNCPTVSYVSFAAAGSGWNIPFGLVDETVEAFQCMERPDGVRAFRPPWGFYDCSI
jgi:hypothetical protein